MFPVRRVLGVAAAVAVAAGAITMAPGQVVSASAATSAAKPGPGLNLRAARHHTVGRTLHAGSWAYGGKYSYCVSYNLQVPDGPVAAGSSVLAMPGREATARANFIVNAYGNTRDDHQAARVWFALANLIVAAPAGQSTAAGKAQAVNLKADLPSYTAQLSAADKAGVQAMLTASLGRGPYRVAVSVRAVQVGQSTTGTVTVLAANGKPAVGRAVAVTVSGARVTAAARVTDRAGRVLFTYQRSSIGSVGFRAVATAPSSTRVWLNRPSAGRQVVLAGGFTETATGTAGFRLSPTAPLVTWTCSTNCDGQSTVTFKAVNPAGAQAIRYAYIDQTGKIIGRQVVKGGTTSALVVKGVRDSTRIARSYCYVSATGSCTTPEVVTKAFVEVLCPAWASVTLTKSCSCKAARTLTYTFTVPASTRFYRVTVTRNGRVVSADLTGGQSKALTVPVAAGDAITAAFTAYRDAAHSAPLILAPLDSFTQH